MKTSIVLGLAALSFVVADDPCVSLTSAFPACPFACVTSAASAVGCTDRADLSCNCIPASSTSIMNLALGCAAKCDVGDLGPALAAGKALCACEATRTKEPTTTATTTKAPTTTPASVPTSTTTGTQSSMTSGTGTGTGTSTGTDTGTDTGTGTGTTTQPSQPCSGGSTGTTTASGSSSSGGGSSSGPGSGTVTSGCPPASQADCGAVASSAVPSCAQQCFTSAAPSVGCKATDFKCQCQPEAQSSLSIALLPCVQKNCPASSLQAIINGASSVCACATAPPSGGSGDCTATPTGTGTATGTATGSVTGTGSIPGSESTSPTCDHDGCGQPTGSGEPTTGGQQPTGNPTGGETTGQGQPPAPTSSQSVPTAGAATYEMSLIAGIFGVFWFAAVAL
ncbi:hypothetical protein QQS21_011794 [Conoideocrella luteorostrata]|uniref:CFEM domain-containing protein n=1 Tax=Conoideocrella luteorostrata TaxID=1105319 RepID=A0AAJ0CF57_9HYPO|nr:hypothetical protein QQS21_011794 [Conoideocrella luteorostrata]